MLIDTQAVRAGATALSSVATDLDADRAAMFRQARGTHWIARAAERIQQDLSRHDARAREAVQGLRAAARHLRLLAEAAEDLEERMRRAHDRRADELRDQVRTLPEGPDREAARTALAGLPGAQDAHWSRRVEVPSVPRPPLERVAPQSLVNLGPFTVSVDTVQVRALGDTVGALSQTVSGGRERTAPARALGLWRLDAYGLPGTAAGTFVDEVCGEGSDLAEAGLGFDMVARRTAALAGIIERSDEAGLPQADLLGDDRLVRAVDLAATLTTGADPQAMWEAVGDTDAEELAWLMTVVPELEATLEGGDEPIQLFDYMDLTDLGIGLYGLPNDLADRAGGVAADKGREAKAIKPVKGASAAQRAAYRAAIREMRSARSTAANLTSVSTRVPGSNVLRVLNTPLSATKPVLRNIPVLSVIMTGIGTADDINNGMSPEGAVVKNVTSTAAGLGAAALTTTALAGTALAGTAVAPVLIAVGVGALVSWGTGKLLEAYGDEIVEFGKDAAGAVWDAGEWAVEGVGDGAEWAWDGLSSGAGATVDGITGAWNWATG